MPSRLLLAIAHLSILDFRMRFANEEWEQERDGWRSVVQLNVVRSITIITHFVQGVINGDTHTDELNHQESVDTLDSDQSQAFGFTQDHLLLTSRLAPLASAEAELEWRLGIGKEPVRATHMVATPFDTPKGNSRHRKPPPEPVVRSWRDTMRQDQRSTLLSNGSTGYGTNSAVTVMAGCRDDMKALWRDRGVQQALERGALELPDSASLSVEDLLHVPPA